MVNQARYAVISILVTILIIISLHQFFVSNASSKDSSEPIQNYVPGELIIKFDPEKAPDKLLESQDINPLNTGSASINKLNKKMKAKDIDKVFSEEEADGNEDAAALFEVELPNKANINKAVEEYEKNPYVEYAQPNYIYPLLGTANDPLISNLWGLDKIEASKAWDTTTGSSQVVVAVIDTGVDYNHPDLAANMWSNDDEIAGNGIDDDNNGFVDDVKGWNFAYNNAYPFDDHSHGTHVAGTIAAVGNNGIGVSGVNWTTKIMAVKFLTSGGYGYTSNAIKAIRYAADNGAKVMNNSWGGGFSDPALTEAVNYAHNEKGVTVVAAAGNSATDAASFSPANIPAVITVSASDRYDNIAYFSNWGNKIDVAAPGYGIYSTIPNGAYGYMSGTSMASPHVAGLAALMLANNPNLTNEQIRQALRQSADDAGSSGWDKYFGYGRINADKALKVNSPPSVFINSPSAKQTYSKLITIKYNVVGSVSSYKLEYGQGAEPATWQQIISSDVLGSNQTFDWDTSLAGLDGDFTLRLTAFDAEAKQYQHSVAFTIDNAQINDLNSMYNGSNNISIYGRAQSTDFKRYELDYAHEDTPDQWSDNGVLYYGANTKEVSYDRLAAIDPRELQANGNYKIRLRIFNSAQMITVYNNLIVEKRLLDNWPITVNNVLGSPLVVDLNNDNKKEIIFISNNGYSYLFVKNHLGQNLSGWPKTLEVDFNNVAKTPAVGDLDGDGQLEIVAVGTSKLYAFRADGSNVAGWPVSNIRLSGGTARSAATPVLSDLDEDGKDEVIINGVYKDYFWGGSGLYVFNYDGTIRTGWPKTYPNYWGTIRPYPTDQVNAAVVGDINNDGTKEILNVVNNNYWGAVVDDYTLNAYKPDGSFVEGYPKTLNGPGPGGKYNSPVLADLDKNGQLEIVFAGPRKTLALKANGDALDGWPVSYPEDIIKASPAVADINNDGQLEVVIATTRASDNEGRVYVFNSQGMVLAGWPYVNSKYKGTFESSPVIANIDSDSDKEIIIGTYTGGLKSEHLIVLGANGQEDTSVSSRSGFAATPWVGDVNSDGLVDITAIGNKSTSSSDIYVLQFTASNNSENVQWPGYQSNVKRSGLYGIEGAVNPFESVVLAENRAPRAGSKINLQLLLKDIIGKAIRKRVKIRVTGTDNQLLQPEEQTDNLGKMDFTLYSTKAEKKIIFVFDASDDTLLRRFEVDFRPASLDKLRVFPQQDQIIKAGEKVVFTTKAEDVYSNEINDINYSLMGANVGGEFNQTKAGTYIVKASAVGAESNVVKVTVRPSSLNQVNIEPSYNQTIIAGQAIRFLAQGQDQYGNDIASLNYNWQGTNALGNFSNVAAGQYFVRAQSNNVNSKSILVTVKPSVIGRFNLALRNNASNDVVTVEAGNTLQFKALAYDIFNNLKTDYSASRIQSSDPKAVINDSNWLNGTKNFSTNLKTVGVQSVEVLDSSARISNSIKLRVVDTTEPDFPTIVSSSHPEDKFYSDNKPLVFINSSDVTGVYGYSYKVSKKAVDVPDNIIETTNPGIKLLPLADGRWVFQVKAVDAFGNWTLANRYQLQIDTKGPLINKVPKIKTRKNRSIVFKYRIKDKYSEKIGTAIRIKKGKKVVGLIKIGSIDANKLQLYRYRVNLPVGKYRYFIYAEDQSGNTQRKASSNWLIVK